MLNPFAGRMDPFAPPAAVQPPRTALRFILHHMYPLRWLVLACAGSTIAAALIEVWLIYYVGWLVDALVTVPRAELWGTLGPNLAFAAAVLLILRPTVAWVNESLCDITFRPTSVPMIRWRVHDHVMRQSIGWFRNQQSGLVAARVSSVGVSATSVVYNIVHTLFYVLTYFLCAMLVLAAIDPRLLLPLAVWSVFYGLHMAYAVPRFDQKYDDFEASRSDLSALAVDIYGSIEAVKHFADADTPDPETKARFVRARTTFEGVQRLEVFLNVGMVVLSNLLLVGLVGYAIYLWQSGDALLGMVAAALTLATRVSSMAEWMLDAVADIYGDIGSLREALRTVADPIDLPDAPGARPLHLNGAAIAFDDVHHHYGQAQGGLNGVTLSIPAGEKLGLVGASGAGKSTLVNLLLRYYAPEHGHIHIDGQDIAKVQQSSLRKVTASVAQDATLLHRSIAENISLGMPDATRADVIAAAKKAEAHDFITAIQDVDGNTGYDAIVGERGVRLSGGQRQRISLARALIRDAPILILDEATSALDSALEADIQEALYRFMADKTVIAIAHRLSTIAQMDRIAVMDKGRIAELGTHHELLLQGGIYAALWHAQSGGRIGAT